MSLVFDVETTGLPKSNVFTDLTAYDSCRIVSIAWILINNDTQKEERESYSLIKPENFYVPAASTSIHKITQTEALEKGIAFSDMLKEFMISLDVADRIIAHNLDFDLNVLGSELYRRGYVTELRSLYRKDRLCTMRWSKELLNLPRYPKLAALYQQIFDVVPENPHNAQCDTRYCYEVYKQLLEIEPHRKPTEFPLTLSKEQKAVVYEDLDQSMLVIACAGSGKTTTILCRIGWLLQNGVAPHSIMLTTFTVSAERDMRRRLIRLLGYMPAIEIGTIDSICRKYIDLKSDGKYNVNEYGIMFLNVLQNPDACARILIGKRYLFVDEYQDISDVQNSIIDCYRRHGVVLTAIGDDAQNIYGWRGSKMEYILSLDKDPTIRVHCLTTNYRSTEMIVEMANASIEHNETQYPKTMSSLSGRGKKPDVRYFSTPFLQDEYITDKIMNYIEEGVNPSDIAILCSQNDLLYNLETMLTRMNVPNHLLESKQERNTTRAVDQDTSTVFLGTIHKAKGLEWKIVFLIHMNDAVFPGKSKDIDESRRVFYVGLTRAKVALHITFTKQYGSTYMTRFVTELSSKLYDFPGLQPHHIGISASYDPGMKQGIVDLIKNLDGTNIQLLRQMNLMPDLEWKQTVLYVEHSHSQFVIENELFTDVGIFVDALICRSIGLRYPESRGLEVGSAPMAIASVKLSKDDMGVYYNYREYFYHNIRLIRLDDSDDSAFTKLSSNSFFPLPEPILATHEYTLKRILAMMRKTSYEHKIPLERIAVMTERFLPASFDKSMGDHWKKYQDPRLATSDIIMDIWEVSKCERIVKEKRRRLLYKKVPPSAIEVYVPMLDDIEHIFLPWIEKTQSKTVYCHESFMVEGISGEIDIRWGTTIIDIKCSQSINMTSEWTMQLLCYAAMAKSHGLEVNHIAILNPLKGIWFIASIANIDDSLFSTLLSTIQSMSLKKRNV